MVSLPMAPAAIEPELCEGTWLIIAFAVWSVTDWRACHHALPLVRRWHGRVRLGLRPLNDCRELHAWHPDLAGLSPYQTPHWILMQEGQVLWRGVGPLSETTVAQAIADH
ncbi:MAG: hypothetical protein FJX77_05595 [Armatimonadetes bacterium]|nr:hypothetical protein [Armatimonadota bacterium]